VIKAINYLWDLGLTPREQMDLGQKVGSDVPFCLMGGTALACGRGEQLTPIDCSLKLNLVLVNPGFPVSTAHVYQLLDRENVIRRPDVSKVINGLRRGDLQELLKGWGNVMETVTMKMFPQLEAVKNELVETGANGVLMSGSGPTIFGVYSEREVARDACQKLRDKYPLTFMSSTFINEEWIDGEKTDSGQT
jgi:4-diphosphocytidyl-2-C-methyl-D-erythritol kinase